jgi:hypothetical protein
MACQPTLSAGGGVYVTSGTSDKFYHLTADRGFTLVHREPLSKRVNALGWHIQINAPAAKIIEIMPILEKVPTPIVSITSPISPSPRASIIRCSPRSAR